MSVDKMMMADNPFANVLSLIADGLRRNRVALLIALALNVGDAISTHIGLTGGLQEGNAIPALLLANGGELAWVGSKFTLVAVVVLLVCLLGRRYPKLWHTFTVTNFVLLAAVLSNSAQLLTQ
ncbi:MAG TPA: DUF5658 family protein [Chloroflexota bacterium]|nr:DUF5658 family protein [Chloroflexota bacterium]